MQMMIVMIYLSIKVINCNFIFLIMNSFFIFKHKLILLSRKNAIFEFKTNHDYSPAENCKNFFEVSFYSQDSKSVILKLDETKNLRK